MRLRLTIFSALILAIVALPVGAQKPAHAPGTESADPTLVEAFEKRVRPALAQYCYECHSHAANKGLGGIYLDSRAAILQGGKRGTGIVPGHPDKSLLVEAISYAKPDLQMPPKGKLPGAVIAELTEWIRHGAVWPADRGAAAAPAAVDPAIAEKRRRSHWAWQPVRRPSLPAVKRKAWAESPIDRFILAKLESRGLVPAPRADRRTLIRRATFDLIGLPPTPEEVEAFVSDKSPNAWQKVIDRLLTSPHYGERWGRYWLDVARYGEDQAHSFEPRLYPQGYRFRDWIAGSLNADMPYDRFVKEQIAADLLNEPDKMDQLPALGFFACGPVYYGDSKMFDQYDDRIDTLSRGFLGLTAACARCHDHKFDPITQKDYYALAGVFASTTYVEVALKAGDDKSPDAASRQEQIKAKQTEVDKFVAEHTPGIREALVQQSAHYILAVWKLENRHRTNPKLTLDSLAAAEKLEPLILERWRGYLTAKDAKDRPLLGDWSAMIARQNPQADNSAAPAAVTEATKCAEGLQGALQALIRRRDAAAAKGSTEKPLTDAESKSLDGLVGTKGILTPPIPQLEKFLTGDPKAHFAIIYPELQRLKMGAFIHALADGPKPANVHVLLRGNPEAPGEEAPRRFLSLIAGDSAPPFKQGSGRLELANAIADRSNPLTARVMVNRIWQHHFGRGLVRTASNFGTLGEPPTHPELLDYLASEFVDHGWSIKNIHRAIMLSATYQMSSAVIAKNDEVDPDDRLLWRMPRRRLDIEAWRDSMLAVSAKLDLTMGGPSQPLAAADNNRRTFYAAVSRHDLDSMLRLFDFPDPNATTDARMTTTVPLQQLFVLNSEFMVRQAKALAARLTSSQSESDPSRIGRAFQLLYNRPPLPRELALGLAFLQGPALSSAPTPALNSANPGAPPPAAGTTSATKPTGSKLTRWEEYAQVLLSANEFMYVD